MNFYKHFLKKRTMQANVEMLRTELKTAKMRN